MKIKREKSTLNIPTWFSAKEHFHNSSITCFGNVLSVYCVAHCEFIIIAAVQNYWWQLPQKSKIRTT